VGEDDVTCGAIIEEHCLGVDLHLSGNGPGRIASCRISGPVGCPLILGRVRCHYSRTKMFLGAHAALPIPRNTRCSHECISASGASIHHLCMCVMDGVWMILRASSGQSVRLEVRAAASVANPRGLILSIVVVIEGTR
jgi:hypothetical protein